MRRTLLAAAGLLALVAPVPATAAKTLWHTDMKAARQLVAMNPQHPAEAILKANCRSIPEGAAILLATAPVECLVIAKNGPGQPLFCGVLDVEPPITSPAAITGSAGYECPGVRKALANVPTIVPHKSALPAGDMMA